MATCFIIQPFDKGPFDKRYTDTIEPAVKAAGLDPYRVDRDPSVQIPIEDIERGIRDASICLADITTDNPNVWFELGYAISSGKDTILICAETRERFPFDIQHRQVIKYKQDSQSDFQTLGSNITERIKALMKKRDAIGAVSSIEPLTKREDLYGYEVACLICVMQNCIGPEDMVAIENVKNDMEGAGYNKLATSLGLRELRKRGFLNLITVNNDFGDYQYDAYKVTDDGVSWLLRNKEKLVLKSESKDKNMDVEEDLPF